jgi:hypothetical protein
MERRQSLPKHDTSARSMRTGTSRSASWREKKSKDHRHYSQDQPVPTPLVNSDAAKAEEEKKGIQCTTGLTPRSPDRAAAIHQISRVREPPQTPHPSSSTPPAGDLKRRSWGSRAALRPRTDHPPPPMRDLQGAPPLPTIGWVPPPLPVRAAATARRASLRWRRRGPPESL